MYSGYKCFKIVKICTNLKYSSFGRMNSSQTNLDLINTIHAHKKKESYTERKA